MERRQDYSNYQVEDLLSDEGFQNWVLHLQKDPQPAGFWEALSEKETALAANIMTAKDLILGIRFKEEFPSDEIVRAALSRNSLQISAAEAAANEPQAVAVRTSSNRYRLMRPLVRAAVIVGVLLGLYWGYRYMQAKATITIETAYGQTKTITLPDSSIVVLNAHSAITYPKHWQQDKTRELTLKGEAYFNIRHLNRNEGIIRPGERFIVHSNQVAVEVLGTRFDVKQKGDIASVLLEQGSIQLTLKETGRLLKMQPGERVIYDGARKHFSRTRVQVADYIGWTNHELVLKGESLKEIAQRLSEYFGLQVKISGSDLEQMKMEGTIFLDSLPDVLFALSTAMNLEIDRQGDTLTFQKRGQ